MAPLTRRRLIGVAPVLAAVILASCSSPAPSTPVSNPSSTGGGLVAQATTVDLGRVPFDKMAEARFDLQNTGARPVKLLGAPQVTMLQGC